MQLSRGESNLYVADLDRAADFYEAALDFEVCESADGYRKLRHGDIVITLFLAAQPGPAPAPGTVPHMSCDFKVADTEIEAVEARLRAAGADVADLTAWEQGRHLMFRDLDGIGWEIVSIR